MIVRFAADAGVPDMKVAEAAGEALVMILVIW
jgi:hypothetical protein